MAVFPISHPDIGLSPLARGTRSIGTIYPNGERFIPAGAGNTRWPSLHRTGRPVYPRWRGEHKQPVTSGDSAHGLSPLARGTLRRALHHACNPRFIPAGAGNTKSRHEPIPMIPVYPRWRGEHIAVFSKLWFTRGLSPLARGTPQTVCYNPRDRRFIPAGAGNTAFPWSSAVVFTVYPRWRGEHWRYFAIVPI